MIQLFTRLRVPRDPPQAILPAIIQVKANPGTLMKGTVPRLLAKTSSLRSHRSCHECPLPAMNAHCPALSCGLNSSSVATFCSHKDHGSCIRQIIFSFAINQLMEITPTSPSSFCTGKVISSMGVQKYALTDEEDTRQCHSRRWDEKGGYICLELVLLYSLFTGLQTEVIHWARRYFKKLMHFHGL